MTGEHPLGPDRSDDELTDMTLEDMQVHAPSEETVINMAETMLPGEIRNLIAQVAADAEVYEIALKDAKGKLEAARFTLAKLEQAYQLSLDANPGV